MNAFDEGLIRMVDARIAAAQKRTDAFGTVISRDTTGPGATVTFDGATVAVPVKVFGNVHVLAGDRVALHLVENRWLILGTFARRQFGEASLRATSSGGTTTSASYVDMPGSPFLSLPKRYDLTAVRLGISASAYTSAQPTVWDLGIRVAGAPNTVTATTFTPVDVMMSVGVLNVANSHHPISGMVRMDTLTAGDYVLTARWRRTSGAGTLTTDSLDPISMEADEIYRITSS